MAAVEGKGESPDFSQPWKFSDVVLVVEDKKLHVHRLRLRCALPFSRRCLHPNFKKKARTRFLFQVKKQMN